MKQKDKLAAARHSRTITLSLRLKDGTYQSTAYTTGQLRDKLAQLHAEALASPHFYEYRHNCRYDWYASALSDLIHRWKYRREVRILGLVRSEEDEYGDSGCNWYVIRSKEEPTREVLHDLGMYRTWCQHEYDCCGHLYYGSPYVEKHLKRNEWLVSQSWHRNV